MAGKDYKVVAVSAGCCQTEIDPMDIQDTANQASNAGYELVEAYIDTTSGCCSGSKKSSILIFKRK